MAEILPHIRSNRFRVGIGKQSVIRCKKEGKRLV